MSEGRVRGELGVDGRIFSSTFGRIVRVIVACVVAGGSVAACGTSNPGSGTATPPSRAGWLHTGNGQGCLIGVSYFNGTDLVDWEGPALQKALLGAGANFQEADAKASPDTQVSDIDGLIAAGAKVIVTEPGPEDVILPALERAANAGIPVVTFFSRPLEHAGSLYVAFDPIEQGRQVARGLVAEKPKGDYAIVKGDAGSLESDLIASGIREILQPAVDRGDIKIVAEVETSSWAWDPALAQQEMTAILSQNGGRVDAVAVLNDYLASGAARALADAGLTGSVAVGGVSDRQGASWGLSAIVRGTQAVDAWGNPERLGEAEAHAAIALCQDPDITRVDGSSSVTWPGRDPMRAILLAPVAITKDNIDIAVKTSTEWRQAICGDGVPAPDWLPACQGWSPEP
jgi:D-xylose transport system substrate-binding protein